MTRHLIIALFLTLTAAQGAPKYIGPESDFTHDLKVLTNAPTWRAGIGVPGWEDFDGLTLSTNGGVSLADPITRDVTITNASFAVYGLPGGTNFADNFYIGGAFSVTNALLNIRSFGALGGTNNDTVAIQAALDAATDGTVVWFPPNPDGYTHNTVTLKHSNVTIDGGNNEINCPTNGTELIRVMPSSLFSSGRLSGTDYPPTWMSGATPAPVDGDPACMMHEHDPSLRITNIVIRNFRSSRDGNLLRAYSVDGLKLEHLSINAPNNSAIRVFHSSDISMTRCDLRGGTGSYTAFFLKCRKANISGNYFHSTGYRSLSFKGAIHKSGTSIFNSLLTTDYEDAQIDIYDNVFDYDWDCSFVDWPPDSGDDVGDVNGLTIGFTKAQWYGRFRGVKFHDNMCSFTGTYSNGKGRTFWASYPHNKITIENNTVLNGGFFLAGVDGGSITGNNLTWTKQSANAIFIQDETGTIPASVTQNISIKGNRLYNYYAAGTGGGTDPEAFYADGLSIDIEENYFYGIATTGVPNLIVIGPSLDKSSIQRNRAYLDSGVAILANIVLSTFGAVNNLHGTTSDNTVFDTATGATKTAGMMIFDNGAGSGFQIIAKGGYAGIGLMASNKVDYLGQIWEDLANTNMVIYHNTAPRITIKRDGSSEFSSYLTLEETTDPTGPLTNKANIYLKDNGSGVTEPFYQTSDGLVNPFGLFYRSGADAVYTNSAAIVSIYNKLSRWYHDSDYNLGLGAGVFGSLSGGGSNVGVGREAGQAFTTADNNVAVGTRALSQSTGGTDNVAVGGQAMRGAGPLADKATMIGESAGFNFAGTRSVHIGRRAGQNYTNSYNTLIGADIGELGTAVPTVTNTVAIGYGVTPRASSTAQIGTNGVSALYLNGTVGWFRGTGSPESAVTAPVGSFYSQEDGGPGTAFYVKGSGTGNTGWSAPNKTSFGLAYSFGATPYIVTDAYADLDTGSLVQTDVLTTGTYLVTATILVHCPADFTAQTAFVKLVNTEAAADVTGSETWSYIGALGALHSQQVTTSAITTITTSGRVKVQVKNGNPATGELAVSETPGCRVTWIKVL